VCILSIFHYSGMLRSIEEKTRNGITWSASPLYTLRTITIEWIHDRFFPLDIKAQKQFETRVHELEQEHAENIFLKEENASLRAQLAFSSEKKQQTIIAHMYGFSTDPNRSSILLDKGTAEGVIMHAPVIAEKGVLIGTISSTQEHSSSVRLLTDHHNKVIASILHKEKQILGVLQGQFKISLIMDRILNSEEVTRGDMVVTAGLEEGIPAGLLIGTVSDITSKQTDPFQTTYITPAIHYNELRLVSILKK